MRAEKSEIVKEALLREATCLIPEGLVKRMSVAKSPLKSPSRGWLPFAIGRISLESLRKGQRDPSPLRLHRVV